MALEIDFPFMAARIFAWRGRSRFLGYVTRSAARGQIGPKDADCTGDQPVFWARP
jgi:hypothetical protein